MIPKIIHYCWFGGKPLPDSAKKCIDSWKKHCPDYEIREWNESNYDVHSCDYISEAYEAKKWAFVSDFARFDILYRYGGLYFDTDVEIIQSLDDIINNGPFMGTEVATEPLSGESSFAINAGLGLGAPAGLEAYKIILDHYKAIHFACQESQKTVVDHVSELFEEYGYERKNECQTIAGITIYPSEFFCPIDNMTGEMAITKNTRTIHHYDATWMNKSGKISIAISRKISGRSKTVRTIGTIAALPFRFINRIKNNGLKATIKHIKEVNHKK